MIDITKLLRSSLQCDAVNGNSFERSVCARQMKEASDEIDRLRAAFAELSESTRSIALHAAETIAAKDAEIARLRDEIDGLRNEVAQLCGYDNAQEMDAQQSADANRSALAGGGA